MIFLQVSSGTQKIDGHARRLGDALDQKNIVFDHLGKWNKMLWMFFHFFAVSKEKIFVFSWKGCNFWGVVLVEWMFIRSTVIELELRVWDAKIRTSWGVLFVAD